MGVEVWKKLILQRDKPQLVARVMSYLTDRVFGKPAQNHSRKSGPAHRSATAAVGGNPDWLRDVVDVEVREPEKLKP